MCTRVQSADAGKSATDAFLVRKTEKKAKKTESGFSCTEESKGPLSGDKRKAQKDADSKIKVDAAMKPYLKARFSLSANQYPHEMKF